jgi:hypothetical protein
LNQIRLSDISRHKGIENLKSEEAKRTYELLEQMGLLADEGL